MADWKPMSTVPRGKLVRFKREGDEHNRTYEGIWEWPWPYWTHHWMPTHWMPLPDPPKGAVND